MKRVKIPLILIAVALIAAIYFFYPEKQEKISFGKDIKPILNKNCMACHGGVKKSGEVSFLFENLAKSKGESGEYTIVPFDTENSELIKRINHDDPEVRMPPTGNGLTKKEIEKLTTWIKEGAEWELHWAYAPPKVTEHENLLEASFTDNNSEIKNEIDYFITEKLKSQGLSLNEQASAEELIRRVSLDLIGLPPKQEWVDSFINEDGELINYEILVDTLLNSPSFGERWAGHWMDLARYGDSMGFQKDPYRSMWRYREWLIKSFNDDKPFNQFTIEQIAGDLLPNATDEQILGSAFYRNSLNNTEGGTDDEEFRVAAVVERINTTWEVWLGTTMSCVQCHDHPYDPFTTDDYYSFMTYLNSSEDSDKGSEVPNFLSYSMKDRLRVNQFAKKINPELEAENYFDNTNELVKKVSLPYLKAEFVDEFYQTDVINDGRVVLNNGSYVSIHEEMKATPIQISYGYRGESAELKVETLDGKLLGQKKINGNSVDDIFKIKQVDFNDGIRISFSATDNKPLAINWINFSNELPNGTKKQLLDSIYSVNRVKTPVMSELTGDDRRTTKKFIRGNWLNHGEEMSAAVPSILKDSTTEVNSRLDMAKWIVSEENPTTARVIANRYWEQLMGKGLVRTLEDFGSQAPKRTHPELLDWLAINLQEDSNWSIKSFLKTIVLSASYQQSSVISEEKLEKDPLNTWYSRYERTRLSAEMIRDQALAVTDLLSDKMYGPSVMPPQPDGVWSVIRDLLKWEVSAGEDKYRRAVYTFWRKTSPYPSFMTFDSPSKEFCTSRRMETNTPLQALVTLNDPVYFEAAQNLALQMNNKSSIEEAMEYGYKKAIYKNPTEDIIELLKSQYEENLVYYTSNMEDAKTISLDEENPAKVASLTLAANTIMNLDEFINKN